MKPKIWFDVDMVLADTVTTVVNMTSKLTGLRILNYEPPTYDEVWKCLETHSQAEVAVAIKTIQQLYHHNPTVYATALPVDGAFAVADFFHQKGVLGGYVSARPNHFQKLTQGWLDMWNFPKATLHCAGGVDVKVRILNLVQATHIVDDYGEFAQRLVTGADCMAVPILIERSYNQNHRKGVKTIRTLYELPALFADSFGGEKNDAK